MVPFIILCKSCMPNALMNGSGQNWSVIGHCLFCYRYWLFRSWGRIGTTIGGNKLKHEVSLQQALRHFEALYEEKTGNMWSSRKHFRKVPGRFFQIDLDYNQVTSYCVCIRWFADSCNPESGRCRNSLKKNSCTFWSCYDIWYVLALNFNDW